MLKIYTPDSVGEQRWLARLAARQSPLGDARRERAVRRIVERVRREGDTALLEYVDELDGGVPPGGIAVHPEAATTEIGVPEEARRTLDEAIGRIERFHEPQMPRGYVLDDGDCRLEHRVQPLDSVAIYVPGGRAAYPSTLAMAAVPARLAGVRRIVLATPPRAWTGSPLLRWAAARLGIAEVWLMGGAHAIAALAFGTERVAAVDKIVGPGNSWVAAAKRLVSGAVGVDMVAGPSEVVVVADDTARAAFVAADLAAQAEHDPEAAAILLTPSRRLALAVRSELARLVPTLATGAVVKASLARYGGAWIAPDLESAMAFAARLAPEHLELAVEGAAEWAERAGPAGAIFVGNASAEAFGDYHAGPSHVLPTGRGSRFGAPLGVYDFCRRTNMMTLGPAYVRASAAGVAALAEAEGLPAHAHAARLRGGTDAD